MPTVQTLAGPHRAPAAEVPTTVKRPTRVATARGTMTSAEAMAWRAEIVVSAQRLSGLITAATELGDPGDSVDRVLAHVDGGLNTWIQVVHSELPTDSAAGDWHNCLSDFHSFAAVAHAATGDSDPRYAVLQAAVEQSAELLKRLYSPPLPALDEREYDEQQFMRGKAMFADLLDQVWAAEADKDLEAQRRPRKAGRNTKAVDACLAQLRFDFGALEGFGAALTGCISMGRSFSLPTSDQIRDLTYEQCIGGLDTMYDDVDEGDTDAATDTTPQTDIPAWRVTAHEEEHGILDIIEGCRAVDITEGDTAHLFTLLDLASDILTDNRELRRTGSADDYYGGCIHKVQAILRGATDMTNTSSALRAIAGVLLQKVDALSKVLDTADTDTQARPDAVVSSTEDVEFTPHRLKTLSHAGAFISRMAAYFRASGVHPLQVDWNAMHAGASVVMSFQDDMEDDASLEQRLNAAVASASVIFEEQPPAHLREDGILRQEDVGKRLVSADSWELVGA